MGKQAVISHVKSSGYVRNVAEKSGNLIVTGEWPSCHKSVYFFNIVTGRHFFRPVNNFCCPSLKYYATGRHANFYRAMHDSAKHGLAIVCCPSVFPSLCDVGGSGSHRLQILKTNCTDN